MISSHCPDLLLLDLGLPDMDGMEVIRQVRQWSSLPIIVVSARSYEYDKVRALDNGADDYITKPFGSACCWPGCAWRSGTGIPDPETMRFPQRDRFA